ncbi:MAG: adenylyl-sulfate kinase [endosymbiont of Seepiophila jonesi]|uniref:Adenylyl-sulfate kinase n=1 Tax=endosymbiont of Lamellibrachia luymesi TaxID=2200907 RepID=A0A370DXM5_9GAMM|nr:MAG: adenylyl-sulfate kinase [endosymbiont of Seepiophila jonesi]RDH90942.1 MAG: adenylyl-sulfate kinase [endosymbiont of Lamellibrachia luymesi]
MDNNIVWHCATVTRERREKLNQHKSVVLWFTGLSGSGKSTLAHALEEQLHQRGGRTYVFDGDNVRHGLCGDLGFSAEDRKENIRRIGEMAKLFVEAGVIALTAFISPFTDDRKNVRKLFDNDDFIEIYCHCSIEECERRDVKGLYKRARAGEISDFTGISSPYEVPENPEVSIDTENNTLEVCVEQLLEIMVERGIIRRQTGNSEEPLSVAH